MSFTFDESKAILKHPAVHAAMSRIVHGHEIEPVQTPTWRFADRDNPTSTMVLFRACVERAVTEALTTAEGRDKERLWMLLRIPNDDSVYDTADVAKQVGIAVEDYAVVMQYGTAGLHSYRENRPA